REKFRALPEAPAAPAGAPPAKPAAGLYEIMPANHRLPYEIGEIITRLFDEGNYREFQPEYAPELLCAEARLEGRPVGIIANRRGILRTAEGPRIGGIVYTESARKVAYFVDMAERAALPLVYLQDVSGFMVGAEAEAGGIIRAGAEMVETMACATVPKFVLTLNHASGAGYYAMAGQGFDPSFTFSWPTARIGVMEGDAAVQAVHGNAPPGPQTQQAIEKTRADYERWLDALYAAARGHCDAVIDPVDSRAVLTLALEVAAYSGRRRNLVLETL
ncbi:MAG TPA: carboxyl transferase domain-containing protein, partial [Bryobacteraceae bacterium]|nr:carboxyl transferase domain-containing protein [Bryobacteraceae bacterium]